MKNIFDKLAEKTGKGEIRQVDIAEKLGISQEQVSRILNKKSRPSKAVEKLAEIYFGGET